jgi:pimeloyl-ACP methyl ester carboxylesterase
VKAYSRPGRMRAGLGLFRRLAAYRDRLCRAGQSETEPCPSSQSPAEKASAGTLFPQMKIVANDVSVVGLPETGHWVMEERPKETIEALLGFW